MTYTLIDFNQGASDLPDDVINGVCSGLSLYWLGRIANIPNETPEKRMSLVNRTVLNEGVRLQRIFSRLYSKPNIHKEGDIWNSVSYDSRVTFDIDATQVINLGQLHFIDAMQRDLKTPNSGAIWILNLPKGRHAIAGFCKPVNRKTFIHVFDPNIGEFISLDTHQNRSSIFIDLLNRFASYQATTQVDRLPLTAALLNQLR